MKITEENLRTPLESFALLVANDNEIITKDNECWEIPLLVGTEEKPCSILIAVQEALVQYNIDLDQLRALYSTGRISFKSVPSYEFYIEDGEPLEEVATEAFCDLVTRHYVYTMTESEPLDYGEYRESIEEELFSLCRPRIAPILKDHSHCHLVLLGCFSGCGKTQDGYIDHINVQDPDLADLVVSAIWKDAVTDGPEPEGQYPEDGGPSIIASIEVSEPDNPQSEAQKELKNQSSIEVSEPDNPQSEAQKELKNQSSIPSRSAGRTTETQSDNLVSEVYDAFVTDALRLLFLQVIILMPAIAFTPLLTLPMFSGMIIATGLIIVGNSTIGKLVPWKTDEIRNRRAGS